MKKFLGSKTAVLVLGLFSLLIIFYLTASLGGLELKAAKPFSYGQPTRVNTPGDLPPWNGFAIVIMVFTVVLVIMVFLLPPEQRKKFLQTLVWLILGGVIIFFFLSRFSLGVSVTQPTEEPGGRVTTLASEPTDTPEPEITPSVFTPPEVSPWSSTLVALVILLVAGGVAAWMVLRKRKKGTPYDALADIASSALEDIEAGREWGDVIVYSYYRMNKVVAEWRGIRRNDSMTPAEFAKTLISAHLPGEAVEQLTSLFEIVRYGGKNTSEIEMKQAVDCLTTITEYCRRVM